MEQMPVSLKQHMVKLIIFFKVTIIVEIYEK